MRHKNFNRRSVKVILAAAAVLLMQSLFIGAGATTTSLTIADVDLSSEKRALDNFVNELVSYDKQCRESGKKARLTRLEFDALQKRSDAIKGRVSGVQNTFREIIRKLKAAGQWENLDAILLAKVSDAKFQELLRSEGFKKTLEDAANSIGNDANEIASPLEALRPKVSADSRRGIEERNLSSLAVRVAYQPVPPTMFRVGLRCRLSWLGTGIAIAAGGNPTFNGVACHCNNQQSACAAL